VKLAVRAALFSSCLVAGGVPSARAAGDLSIPAAAWHVVEQKSGPVNYYSVVSEEGKTFVRSRYTPPLKTVVLGWKPPDAARSLRRLSWVWRARVLPVGGDECVHGKGDSAAVVYVSWKRGLRYYTLKYVWSSVGKKGNVCDRKRNPFIAQDTVVLESGPGDREWRRVELDLDAQFRAHFAGGDAVSDVPPLFGIGLMSDGDQTGSVSSADFGTFTLSP
jgi:hypothetical protein